MMITMENELILLNYFEMIVKLYYGNMYSNIEYELSIIKLFHGNMFIS